MATFNCPQITDYDKVFKGVNPNYKGPPEATSENIREIRAQHGGFSPEQQRGPNRDFRELFQLGKAYGFKNSDWTLFYNDEERNSYQAPNSSDLRSDGFVDLVQGELLRRLKEESPSLVGKIDFIHDIEELFGERNSCIEEETVPVQTHDSRDKPKVEALCVELDKLRKKVPKPLQSYSSPNNDEKLNDSIRKCYEEKFGQANTEFEERMIRGFARESLDLEKYDVGRSVAGTCFQCHSKDNEVLPDSVAFFESEEATKAEMRKGPEFMQTVKAYINSGRMPKGIPLEQSQREAFLYYMENLYIDALTSSSKQ